MANKLEKNKITEKLITQPFNEIIRDSFRCYAKYIIQERALPDIRDGLKPVQRRILYAMHELGLKSNGAYKKSARTVGEVIGKYHPHGDSSIYEALVRMSQEWKNNLVLINMQGNKGSIDGDPPAAMRYTEAKLSLFAERLLTNIEKRIVPFVRNFDDSEIEPVVLPAILPNLLINGSSGIAAGYATNIPPHNPTEVMNAAIFRLENPNCSLSQLCHVIKGPDFPTGGIIQGTKGIKSIYETGQGKINIVSQINYDPIENALIVTSIPFETNKSNILKSIDDIVSMEKISGISDVVDSSDKNGINIVIKLSSEMRTKWENIKNYLLKNTALQVTYSANMVAIINAKPVQFNLLQYFDAFLESALKIIINTSKHELENNEQRLEIVSGLIKATDAIEPIIKIIRHAKSRENARDEIVEKLGFSLRQAEAIIRLRLYSLTNTDTNHLHEEESQLKFSIDRWKKILSDETCRKEFLRNKIMTLCKEFPSRRCSKIETKVAKLTVAKADLIQQKSVYVAVSQDGYIKSTLANFTIEGETYSKYGLKKKDLLMNCYAANNSSSVVLITSKGNYINIPIYKIKLLKWGDLGTHINYLTPLGENERIVEMFVNDRFTPNSFLTLVSKNGLIKRVQSSDLTKHKLVKATPIMRFKSPNDEIVSTTYSNDDQAMIYLFTCAGRALKYSITNVPIFSLRASGVKALKLTQQDQVVAGLVLSQNDANQYLCVISSSGAKRISLNDVHLANKNNIGKTIFTHALSLKNCLITVGVTCQNTCLNVIYEDGTNSIIKSTSIPISEGASRLSYWKTKILKARTVNLTEINTHS